MARMGAMQLGLPEFRGGTRRLVLANLVAYFALLVFGMASSHAAGSLAKYLSFIPDLFLNGYIWQPFTYSFIHLSMLSTLFELLSLWFLASFLENFRGSNWVISLYATSVLGTAITAAVIYDLADKLGHLIAIGVLYGDTEFLMFFLISIKARYLAAIYALIAIASLFGQNRLYAFAQLGGALAGLLFIRFAPRRGLGFLASEWMFGLRNSYYRWKRRRAGRKFEVYMRKQGRTIRLDNRGRPIDDDPNDRSRWN
jgi:membrane associated rhomboid family serine protease